MYADVEIYEGGQMVRKERMRLKMVKELGEAIIYENEHGRPVVYFKDKDRYILISYEMA